MIYSPVIAINGKWPSPTVKGNINDTIVVNVNNNLGNQSLTIHWHGLFQTNNNDNDGTPVVAQCPIIPGSSYTYTFQVYLLAVLVQESLETADTAPSSTNREPIGIIVSIYISYSSSLSIEEELTTQPTGHSPSQYVDGIRGPLIIDDPNSPYAGQYDEEIVMTVSDWYHGKLVYSLQSLKIC
jgi:iron transport multicopper oxidase